MKEIGLPIALAIIMFGMGLGLTLADFTRVFKNPKAFAVGTFLQVVSLPILTILIIWIFNLSGPFAVGMMILAACPGGVTSNILTYIGKGDVALSVSLTAIISVLGFITVPLITGWSLINYMGEAAPELPITQTVIGIFVITTVPVVLGMIVRRVNSEFASKAERVFGPLSMIVFIAVVIGALIAERDNVVAYISQTGVPTIALNLLTMMVAAGVAALLLLPRDQKTAITLECGLQNATLGITVAATMLGRTDISIPVAVYGLLMLFTGFAYAMWAKKQSAEGDGTELE